MNLKSQQLLFWALQITGWGIPSFLNGYGKYIYNTDPLIKKYIILETLLFFILGIFWTTILRNYIKNYIASFDSLKKDYSKVIIGYVLSSIGYTFTLIGFSYLAFSFILEKNMTLSFGRIVSSALNIFLFVLFWLLFYISIKTLINSKQRHIEYLQLESSFKDSQLNTLKGQINPHFMFNSLNNIRGLMLEDVEKARDMITRLSELLRYSLSKSSNSTIKLKEELEMVSNFIALSHIQFEDRLTYNEEIDSNLFALEIPPMIIQMLIENAIKHGISQQKNGGTVHLQVLQRDKNLEIKVSNTGQLENNKESTKIGLKNISDRLRILYGDKANFKLFEEKQTVIAHIQIPL
ncbi:sensor histidine kinase [Tenacibaculum sp. 190524A05c]|uniref:Two-component system, LytTR family, sensor kinase n=1 Tax=Tenacibaculum platacis TaxID=3137852 RepID=A0ABM9NW84_9FLAO